MKPWLTWTLRGLLLALVIIQFVPVDRTNPPVTAEISVDPEVMTILKTACYDCHSNQTVWPWYSYVAPVSYFVADHVHVGRDELNFSEWGDYSERRRNHKWDEVGELVENGEMPLPSYLWLHGEAKLSAEQVKTLMDWAALAPENPPRESGNSTREGSGSESN